MHFFYDVDFVITLHVCYVLRMISFLDYTSQYNPLDLQPVQEPVAAFHAI